MNWGVLVGVLGIVLAIASIGYSVYSRNRPLTDSDLRYAAQCTRIAPVRLMASRTLEGVGITYRDKPVTHIDQIEIAFRNFGPGRLNADDLEEPVTVRLSDGIGEFLEISGCEQRNERELVVSLLPMQVGQVIRMRAVHTFEGVTPETITVDGAIRNLPHGIRRADAIPLRSLGDRVFALFLGLGLVTIGWTLSFNTFFESDLAGNWPVWVKSVVAIVAPVLAIAAFVAALASLLALMTVTERLTLRVTDGWRSKRSPFGEDGTLTSIRSKHRSSGTADPFRTPTDEP